MMWPFKLITLLPIHQHGSKWGGKKKKKKKTCCGNANLDLKKKKTASFHVRTFLLAVWEMKEKHWVQLYLQASQAGLDYLNRGPLWLNSTQLAFPFQSCCFCAKNWETRYDSHLMTSTLLNPLPSPKHSDFFFHFK